MSTTEIPVATAAPAIPAIPPRESTTSGPGAGKRIASAKVAISFLLNDSDDALVVAIGRILAAMAGNPVYPAPQPTLEVVGGARDAYVAAVLTAKDRSHSAILRRRQLRGDLVALLRTLALYVQKACDGDLVKLVSSGYPAQHGRSPRVGILPPPQNLRLARTHTSGNVRARCKATRNAMSYQWRWSNAAQTPAVWTTSDPVSTASYTIEGLAEGSTCNVQVRVFSKSGPSDWSDVAAMVVG